jgi:hypothetical protein
MKKVLLGCLGVLLLATIAGGIGAYYFIYRPAKSYVQSLSQLQEIPRLNAQVRNRASFTPPGSGELTQGVVERFVAVQTSIHGRLGARLQELDAKYKALSDARGGEPSIAQGLSALKDLGTLILDAKRVQVDALNQHGFSVEEYDWVRRSVYAASGIPMSADVQGIIEAASSGQAPTAESLTQAAIGEVPAINKTLVVPHLKTLQENAGLAFFGL